MHVFPWNKLKTLLLQCCKYADICSSINNVHTAHDIRKCLHIIPWQVHPMWHWLLCDYDVRPVVKRLETLKEWYINLLFFVLYFFWPDITRAGIQGVGNATLPIYQTAGLLWLPIARCSFLNKQIHKKAVINTAWTLNQHKTHQGVTGTGADKEIQ